MDIILTVPQSEFEDKMNYCMRKACILVNYYHSYWVSRSRINTESKYIRIKSVMEISISIIIWETLISRENKMHDDSCCCFQTLCRFNWKWALCTYEFEFGAFSSSCLFPVSLPPSAQVIYANTQSPTTQHTTSLKPRGLISALWQLEERAACHYSLPLPPLRASFFSPPVARRLHISCHSRKITDYIYASSFIW